MGLSLDPVSKVHGLSAIRTYFSPLGEGVQPRSIAIAYNVLSISCTTLTNNLKDGFSCLVGSFVRWSMDLGLGGSVLSAQMGKFHVSNVCIFIY